MMLLVLGGAPDLTDLSDATRRADGTARLPEEQLDSQAEGGNNSDD